MPLSKQEWLALEKKAHELRRLCLDTTYWAGSGHIGGGMSVMDMLTVLYHKYMRLDVKNPKWEDRDRFILSKGHAGIAYAPVLVDFGWNDPEQLKTFNHTNSKMGIHSRPRTSDSSRNRSCRKSSRQGLQNILHPRRRRVRRGFKLGSSHGGLQLQGHQYDLLRRPQ